MCYLHMNEYIKGKKRSNFTMATTLTSAVGISDRNLPVNMSLQWHLYKETESYWLVDRKKMFNYKDVKNWNKKKDICKGSGFKYKMFLILYIREGECRSI